MMYSELLAAARKPALRASEIPRFFPVERIGHRCREPRLRSIARRAMQMIILIKLNSIEACTPVAVAQRLGKC